MAVISTDARLTAHGIARVRAEEAALPESERLFDDPYAHLFDDPVAEVEAIFERIPFFREQVRLRTRFIDDSVRSALAGGTRHVVLVGAGFDMRAFRMREIRDGGATVFEVDHADQLAEKRERLAAEAIPLPSYLRFTGVDLADERLEEFLPAALFSAGLPRDVPVLWVWEGLVGYLSPGAVGQLAAACRGGSGPGSRIVANYFVPTWGSDILSGILTRAGWAPAEAPSFEEMHRRWIGDRVPPGSELFAFAVAGC